MKEFFVNRTNMQEFHKVCEFEHVPYTITKTNSNGYKVKMEISKTQFKMLMEKALCSKKTQNPRTPYISPKIIKNPKALGSVLKRYQTRAAKMNKKDLEHLLGYDL